MKERARGIAFSEIPHQSKLFLEYLREPGLLRQYYPNVLSSFTEVSGFVPEVLNKYTTDRSALCDALKDINSHIGASEKTFENIALLRSADTVAVVTGQQAGLFTGPLYTIYKALSAIKMAEYLNANGTKAVPVFWVATEDHDLNEVSRTFFTGNSGELVEAHYEPKRYLKNAPVGSIDLDDSINGIIEDAFGKLPHTEFSDEVREAVDQSWPDGRSFGQAFAKNLANLLGKFGLIFVDPLHDGLKSLSAPIYADATGKSDEIVVAIRTRNRELERDGFHSQVLVEEDYFPLFWHDDEGRRLALRKARHESYQVKGGKQQFTLDELSTIAKNEPQRFSPGVMLRPVVQDFLFPTICYFGGAAEIAYFAQSSEAYKVLGRPVTPILHRQSFTLLEAKHRRTLNKYGLDLTDLFAGVDSTLERVGMKQLSVETGNILDEAEKTIDAELERLDKNFSQIDAALTANLAKRRRKIMYHIAALRRSAYLTMVRKDETVDRQIRSACNALLPKGQLQERVLNVHSFLNRYGAHFTEMIYDAIDLSDKDHRVIEL